MTTSAALLTGCHIVVCGSLSQAERLDRVAEAFSRVGATVLHPEPSDRPEADLNAEWLAAIETADLVVVVLKSDSSLGAQTRRELAHALAHDRVVIFLPATP